MFVYPDYDQKNGSKNFDICLIKTFDKELKNHNDLSARYSAIPCLPDGIDIKQVRYCENSRFLIKETNSNIVVIFNYDNRNFLKDRPVAPTGKIYRSYLR